MERKEQLIKKIEQLGFEIGPTLFKNKVDADNNKYTHRFWTLPEENKKLVDTKFYSDEKDFIHFTSIEALFGILNSKHLRLYNLMNMDDKYELDYALKALSFLRPEYINELKEKLYVLSMCSSTEILEEDPKKKKHILWKLHGRDGKGVILRLKIENNANSWNNFYLTKCFYELESFKAIKELNELTSNEHLDVKVASFIKLPIYEFENEVRLVFDRFNSGAIVNENKDLIYPVTYLDKLTNKDNISYFQLPLYNFYKGKESVYVNPPNFTNETYEIPKISIQQIILGYRYSENDLKNLRERIEKFDSSIKVSLSELKEYY